MDSSSTDSNLKAGTKLDLPYWLVKSIYNDKFKFVNVESTKSYKKPFHDILDADAAVVDLRKAGPHYYNFGMLLVNLLDIDTAQSIAKALISVIFFSSLQRYIYLFFLIHNFFDKKCFRNRFRRTMDLSNQVDHSELYKAINKLDTTEMDIFKAGQADAHGFLRWQRREFCRLQASSIVSANKNKRKRKDSETDG